MSPILARSPPERASQCIAMTLDASSRLLLDPHTGPVSWLVLSLAVYVLAAHLTWAARWLALGGHGWLAALLRVPWLPGLVQIIRFAYYLLVPYLALVSGVLTPRSLGLAWPDSPIILRQTAIAAAGLAALLALTWAHYARNGRPPRAGAGGWPAETPALAAPFGWAIVLREAVFLQAHWAFYRAACAVLLPVKDLGTWLGLVLILFEGYLNPQIRQDLRCPGRGEPILLAAQIAVGTTVLFVTGGSTWLTLAWHAALALTIPWWVRRLQLRASPPAS